MNADNAKKGADAQDIEIDDSRLAAFGLGGIGGGVFWGNVWWKWWIHVFNSIVFLNLRV